MQHQRAPLTQSVDSSLQCDAVRNLHSARKPFFNAITFVPAGTAGAVNAFASNATQLILDINGYFAP